MNKLNRIKYFLLLLLICPLISYAQQKDVLIRIIQEESTPLNDFQTNLTLKKKPFKFQILLQNVGGVYIFASIKDSVYRFTETSPIRDFSYLNLLELRDEDHFNLNKELNLSETGWSYWFYNDSADWHPYNRKVIGLGDNRVVCTKAIKQFYDVAEARSIKLKNLNAPLYLFFIAVKELDENGKPKTELMRRKVKIDWVGDN